MSIEADTLGVKAMMRGFVDEVWNKGNLSAVDTFMSADAAVSMPMGEVVGPDGFKGFVTLWRQAFPDWQVTIEELVVEGDKLAQRWVGRGTHRGELQGIPPTGRQVMVTGIDTVRLVDGKIAARWGEVDTLGMLQQLGVIPAPEQASTEPL
jgi:predicted ester cyclase